MNRTILPFLAIFLMASLMGVGCTSNKKTVVPPGASNSGNGTNVQSGDQYINGLPIPEMTPEGYKVYVSIEKDFCASKDASEVCKLTKLIFFQDSKGCGCLSPNTK